MEAHMAFFIGKGSESLAFYAVVLAIVFVLSLLVEWLSHTRFLSDHLEENDVGAGLLQTGLYGVRMAMAYLVMLSVMSFDAGILVVAVSGFGAGFLVFGSRASAKDEMGYCQPSDVAVAGFGAGFLVFGSRASAKDEMGYCQPSDLPQLNC